MASKKDNKIICFWRSIEVFQTYKIGLFQLHALENSLGIEVNQKELTGYFSFCLVLLLINDLPFANKILIDYIFNRCETV